MQEVKAQCYDCDRPYGESGFEDLIIPNDVWRAISPTRDEGGLLCPSCILGRLSLARIHCEGALMSGPLRTVSPELMDVIRRIENIEESSD